MKSGLRFFAIVCCVGMQYQILVAEPGDGDYSDGDCSQDRVAMI